MIVADDPVATEYASATIMDQATERGCSAIEYPYQLRLPVAPYRFIWRDEPAVDAERLTLQAGRVAQGYDDRLDAGP
jgi:hypothetical protein